MPNGAVRWLEDQDRVERNASGMPIRAVGVLRDITARKDAEEAQARLAAIVTSSADAIIGKTLDGIVTSWNEAAERVFGYSADEMIGQSIRRLIPADRRPEEDMILARLARSECIKRYETVRTAKDGRIFDASITISPVRDAEGRVIGAAKIIRDITERKRTEARLAEREGLLALFVEHAPAVIAMFDDKMRYLAVSRRYVSDFRLPADIELIGRSHYEIFSEIPPRWREVHARVLAGEELAHEEDPFLRLDGRTDWCRWLMKPWRTADGRIGGALLFSEVITAQVEARRALADSEARFRSSLLHSPLPVLLFDDREQILALSQSWLDQTGYSREELCRIEDWTARAYGARSGEVLEDIRQIISTEPAAERAELAIRTKSGCERVWSFVSSALGAQSDGRRLFVCVAQDVTEQKSHEEHVQLLMREINHRAKNMLSIVQAIARQTTARDPEDFVERFAERIQALAANQDLLIRNEWHGVDVEALVRAQLAHFADLVGSRIDVRGPKLRLNPAAAQAIGLTLHELATNAGKYGAISMNGGHVDVCWGIDDDTLTMSWTERDGPPVLPPERRGFGTTVIASMAKATVGGEVQLDYDPSGLVWRLSCPVANALEG
jgi:PAS domain S-box-containing protein